MKYRVLIEQDEDGVFVAEVPSLPGCISQGATLQEALSGIREAMTLYLESLDAHGDPIPPPVSEEIVGSLGSCMAQLPVLSGREVVRARTRIGYREDPAPHRHPGSTSPRPDHPPRPRRHRHLLLADRQRLPRPVTWFPGRTAA